MEEKISQIEKLIFDTGVINSLPFSFFNFLASVIVNADKFSEIQIPLDSEEFFKINKPKESQELFSLLTKENITNAKSFVGAYRDLFLYRYKFFFSKGVRWSLRKIQSPAQYGLFPKYGVKQAPKQMFLTFDIDEYIPKLENGDIDLKAFESLISKNSDIQSMFSVITSISTLAPFIKKNFVEETTRGFLPIIYEEEIDQMIMEISDELIYNFAKQVYSSIKGDIPILEPLSTLKKYYSQNVDFKAYQIPDNLNELDIKLRKIIIDSLSKIKDLSPKTQEETMYEILEIVYMCIQMGLVFPDYYYDIKMRTPNELDKQDYQVRVVLDLFNYNDRGVRDEEVFESYGVIVDEESIIDILNKSFNSDLLTTKLISLNK